MREKTCVLKSLHDPPEEVSSLMEKGQQGIQTASICNKPCNWLISAFWDDMYGRLAQWRERTCEDAKPFFSSLISIPSYRIKSFEDLQIGNDDVSDFNIASSNLLKSYQNFFYFSIQMWGYFNWTGAYKMNQIIRISNKETNFPTRDTITVVPILACKDKKGTLRGREVSKQE